MKSCTRCGEIKNYSLFYKHRWAKDGFRSECKSCSDKDNREYSERKVVSVNAYKNKWAAENTEKIKEISRRYRAKNVGPTNARTAKRRAKKMNATPKWLTSENYKEIREFYTLAKELSWLSERPLHVDHIIPLQGDNVSGLHVPWNLQILPEDLNCRKSNKYESS